VWCMCAGLLCLWAGGVRGESLVFAMCASTLFARTKLKNTNLNRGGGVLCVAFSLLSLSFEQEGRSKGAIDQNKTKNNKSIY
jgi:hypothetical protein